MDAHLLQQIENYLTASLPPSEHEALAQKLNQDTELSQYAAYLKLSMEEEDHAFIAKVSLPSLAQSYYKQEKELSMDLQVLAKHEEYFDNRSIVKKAMEDVALPEAVLAAEVESAYTVAQMSMANSTPQAAAGGTLATGMAGNPNNYLKAKKALSALAATLGFLLLCYFVFRKPPPPVSANQETAPLAEKQSSESYQPSLQITSNEKPLPFSNSLDDVPIYGIVIHIEELEQLLEPAQEAYNGEKYQEAYNSFERLLQSSLFPKEHQDHVEFYQAICQLKLNNPNFSIPIFKSLSDRGDIIGELKQMAHFYTGAAFLHLNNNYEKAEEYLSKIDTEEAKSLRFENDRNLSSYVATYRQYIQAQTQ